MVLLFMETAVMRKNKNLKDENTLNKINIKIENNKNNKNK